MIEAVYHRKFNRVTVKGHAESGPKGHDLICAGVSALVGTLAANVQWLSDAYKGDMRDMCIDTKEGTAEISVKSTRKYKAVVELIFSTVCMGFALLAERYPENITYEERE